MISQFRSLNPVNLLLLAVVATILRAGILVKLPESMDYSLFEPYTGLLISVPEDLFTPFSNVFYATVIVLVQATILNRIINNYNLTGKPSFMPALMYVTASAVLEPFLVLTPALIANFLVLWMLSKFLSIYRKEKVLSVMFDLGMITGAGTLIYYPFISMLPLLWIILMIFRPFNWREWMAGLTGFIVVWFFIGTALYLNDTLDDFIHQAVPLITTLHTGFRVNLYDYIVLIPVALILILSVFMLRQKFYRSSVHIRKSYFVLLFMLIFAFLSFSLKSEYRVYHFLLAVPPVSVFMANYFVNASRKWLYESLYLLLAVFIIYFQFV